MQKDKDARIRIEAPGGASLSGRPAAVLKEPPSGLNWALLILTFAFSGLSLYLSFFAE